MPARQPITPQLRGWIIAQAQLGLSPPVVLQAMIKAGWRHDSAVAAMEEVLETHLHLPPGGGAVSHGALAHSDSEGSQPTPVGVTVPQLAIPQEAWRVDVAGHVVQVLAQLVAPRVVVLGNVFSADECQQLIAAARPRLKRSLTVQTNTGDEEMHVDRTSSGMFFERGESPLICRIEARIGQLLGWPVDHGEGLQILRYGPGAEYKPHYDYFDPAEPGTPKILQRGGQRVATLIVYLATPEAGGSTVFPDVGLEVAPQQGHAVFFNYPRAHPASLTLHGGTPVRIGEKWIATKWLRERVFK